MGNSIEYTHALKLHVEQLELKIDTLEKKISNIPHNNNDEQGYEIDIHNVHISDISESVIIPNTSVTIETVQQDNIMDNIMDNRQLKAIIQCNKCNKIFKYKSRLMTHLNRKIPCVFKYLLDIKDFEEANKAKEEHRFCIFCNRIFASNKYLKTHINKNCHIALNEHNRNKGIEISNKSYMDVSHNIVINNSVVTNKFSININGFENLDFITEYDVIQMYDSVLTTKMKKNIKEGDTQSLNEVVNAILYQALILVYNNKYHPENYNMFIPLLNDFMCSKEKKIMIYKKEGWSLEDSANVYHNITNTIIYNLLSIKHPRGPDYNNISKQIFKTKELSESIILPVIENIKNLDLAILNPRI